MTDPTAGLDVYLLAVAAKADAAQATADRLAARVDDLAARVAALESAPSGTPTPVPTPDPVPDPTPTPDPVPTPDPAPTGSYGHTSPLADLTPKGSQTYSTAGQVVEGVHITGSITIKANGVVLRNGRLTYSSSYGVFVDSSVTVPPVFEDWTFVGGGMNSSCVARPYEPITYRRCDVSRSCDGIKVRSGTKVHDSFIHDLYVGNDAKGNWVHSDGIQIEGGKGMEILRNKIRLTTYKDPVTGEEHNTGDNCCIMASTDFEDIDDLLIDGNDFFGGQYCVQIVQKGTTKKLGNNVRLTNNLFHPGGYRYGPYVTDPQVVRSGNVYTDGTPA